MAMAKVAWDMRSKLILAGLMVHVSICVQSQDDPTSSAAPRIVKIEDRWEDKIVLEITNDMWLNTPEGVELNSFSPGFKGYFFSDYSFGKSDFSWAWGLGVSVDNVRSNAAFILSVNEDGSLGDQVLTPFPEGYEFERNKFVTTYLELPIEFRYIKTGRNPFKFAAGFRVGYMLSNHQKIIDTDGKRKFYDFDNINDFRYGVSARIGVGKIQLTGFYSLVPLIEADKGTDLIPVSIGLAFTFIK